MKATRRLVVGFFLTVAWAAATLTVHGQQIRPTVSEIETLRGHKAMSVDIVGVYRRASREISESFFRSQVEDALRSAGITVLPKGSYPMLRLWVMNSCCVALTVGATTATSTTVRFDVHAVNLFFVQLLPLPGNTGTVEAMTWRRSFWGWESGPLEQTLSKAVQDPLATFVQNYRSVNR